MSKAHTEVEVVAPDPLWPARFSRTKDELAEVFPSASIEHVGSSSVPGLASKDTIDIAVGVASVDEALTATALDRLSGLGFEYVAASFASDPDHAFLHRIIDDHRTDHIHVMRIGSDAYESHLLFRDYLRAHTDERLAYERAKIRLARECQFDRDSYVDAKQEIVEAILVSARAWSKHTR